MKIGVIGAGAWGTALAKLSADAGHDVLLWAFETDVAAHINSARENAAYLPGIALPKLRATADIKDAVNGRDILISVVPSHVTRAVWEEAGPAVTGDPIVISATKGIEQSTLASMVEVLRDVIPRRLHGGLCALSGPSFAREVASAKPTVVVVASRQESAATQVQDALRTPYFRIYRSTDVAGVEIGGAVKNVIAIAAGVADGLGSGHNARAALITRGLAETTRLAVAKGANPLTLAGLSGMGDLVLTCTGGLSRNREAGIQLGRGKTLEQILESTRTVAEGIKNASSVRALATRLGVEMPLVELVHRMLHEEFSPDECGRLLMGREQKSELETYRP